jgi:hypothetical protein
MAPQKAISWSALDFAQCLLQVTSKKRRAYATASYSRVIVPRQMDKVEMSKPEYIALSYKTVPFCCDMMRMVMVRSKRSTP